jgi:hypothetical protein
MRSQHATKAQSVQITYCAGTACVVTDRHVHPARSEAVIFAVPLLVGLRPLIPSGATSGSRCTPASVPVSFSVHDRSSAMVSIPLSVSFTILVWLCVSPDLRRVPKSFCACVFVGELCAQMCKVCCPVKKVSLSDQNEANLLCLVPSRFFEEKKIVVELVETI